MQQDKLSRIKAEEKKITSHEGKKRKKKRKKEDKENTEEIMIWQLIGSIQEPTNIPNHALMMVASGLFSDFPVFHFLSITISMTSILSKKVKYLLLQGKYPNQRNRGNKTSR